MNRGQGSWGHFFSALSASERGRSSQDLGEAGETMCRALMAKHGLVCIERVHTPWKVTWKMAGGQRVIDKAWPVERVSGDFIAMDPVTGKKAHVEAKATEEEDRIIFSRFKPHQIEALESTVKHNGISFIFVMIQSKGFLLSWPVEGFSSGSSLVLKNNKLFVRV